MELALSPLPHRDHAAPSCNMIYAYDQDTFHTAPLMMPILLAAIIAWFVGISCETFRPGGQSAGPSPPKECGYVEANGLLAPAFGNREQVKGFIFHVDEGLSIASPSGSILGKPLILRCDPIAFTFGADNLETGVGSDGTFGGPQTYGGVRRSDREDGGDNDDNCRSGGAHESSPGR